MPTSRLPQKLYKVTMNWQGEVHSVYRWATSVDNALQLAFVHLAKKLGMNKTHRIANYFLSGKDNIEVREVQHEEKDRD
jgi:hypothetical protein